MFRSIWLGSVATIVLSALLYLFVSCVSVPENPYNPSNAKIWLTLKSASGRVSVDSLTDSVSNIVTIGITAYLPEYIDSIGISVYSSPDGNFDVDTVLKKLTPLQNRDTLWYKVAFATSGKKTLTATVFASAFKNPTIAYFTILDKPIKSVPHSWPHLVITGTKNITAAQTCSLSVSVNDSNASQAHTFYVKQDTLPLSVFTPPFKWIPPIGFIGNHFVFFKVTDTDSPAYFDTQTVTITVSDTSTGPHWGSKTLSLSGAEGSTISLTLTDISTGDSLSYLLMPGLPAKDTIINSVYSYAFAVFDTNNYYPRIIAKDKNGNTDTMTIHLWASQTNIVDSIGPKITKISGPATNTRTASPNDTLVYSVTDQSGVDTVSWTLNSGTPTVLLPDANGHYTILAVLSTYQSNKIVITASDKSSSHNKSTDTTLLDYNVAPKANNQNISTKKNTPLSITLTADPIDGDSLSGWTVVTPPANGTLSGTAPVLTYTPPTGFLGSDSLTFTVTDGKNTSNVGKIKINVSDVLVAPVAGKTIADIAVNKGQPASFAATVNSDANPTPVFSWFKEGGTTSISAIQTYTISQTNYTDQGRYHYIVSNSQGTDTSNWITLTVKDITKPVIVLKGANPQSIMVGGKYTELGDSAYDDKDGIITSKVVIDTSKVKVAQIGTYQVTYSVKDSTGNADTVTRSVQINGNAPVIGTISGNKETCINVAAVFSVSATGSQSLKYQWMKGTAAAPGNSTDSIYSITPLSIADAGSFYCVVSNGISPDAQSQNMTLTVDSPPTISSITASPSTMPICSGTQVAFTVTAAGTAPLVYSWKKNGSAIATAPNSATYTITSVAAFDSGQYSCTVSNGCTPSAMSSNVHLTVTMPPTISAPTANTTISKIVGDTVTLTVSASGTGTLSYQWYKGSSTVGTNSASFPIKPIAFTDSGAYTCAVSNGCGNVTSKIITLSVSSRPTITTQPKSQTLYLSQPDTFSVVATGVPQPTYQWKKNGATISGQTNASLIIALPGVSDSGKYTVTVTNTAGAVISDTAKLYAGIKSAAAGGYHSLYLLTDGRLFGCGNNSLGQLGDNTTINRYSPVFIRSGVQSVAAGDFHSLILTTDGTLFSFGNNSFGQLGDGTTTDRHLPVQIKTGVKSIAAGANHSFILMTDGTLFGFGWNSNGQLGDGTTTDRHLPVQIMPNVQYISAGSYNSLILGIDGTLFACGNNSSGQLGTNSTANSISPVQIWSGVQSAAAGGAHSLILTMAGNLLSCGSNDYGQLGNGTTNSDSIPMQIKTGIQSVAAGVTHSLILSTNGTLFACGSNSNGQLGDGTTNNDSLSEQISTGVKSIGANENHSFYISSDGRLFTFGDNSFGQLGDGTAIDRHTPIEIKF